MDQLKDMKMKLQKLHEDLQEEANLKQSIYNYRILSDAHALLNCIN